MNGSVSGRPYRLALLAIVALFAVWGVNGFIDVGAAVHDAVCAEHKA